MLNIYMLNIYMLNIYMLNINTLNIYMLNTNMLNIYMICWPLYFNTIIKGRVSRDFRPLVFSSSEPIFSLQWNWLIK